MKYNLITVLGPTAAGKTRLAAQLAHRFNGEIISADSRQVYRSLNIGTGKDLDDYIVNGKQIKYHLIDVVEPTEEFNLYSFNRMFYRAYEEIVRNNKIPFLAGGTPLYIHSILKGYKLGKADFSRYEELNKLTDEDLKSLLLKVSPKLHNTTDLSNRDRMIKAIIVKNAAEEPAVIKIDSLVIGIKYERNEIKKRITERLKKRLKEGMIEEAKELIKSGLTYEKLEFFGLEYKYLSLYLKGELNYNDMFQKLNSAIHNFAKRQMTWYRKMEREGIEIFWLDGADVEKATEIIKEYYFNE
ncbi:tRNA dimethylallyltransferase [Melioribacter roseus P3M-2]|uniref:tRNA dimethylallyltransferase n=1 Tax=Melioribacter roseus (strain DSM 23840 / JCM 17771 / VKM B-2668 / P3M-2) TaxID=1191523 RepID=I6Z4C7_MELRP|nr:tRNA (adenosine(37)-N6)-dimethylallyltransferase MiaA [Melioribacter roseus]AFN73980.1 tRNA dimethylallyltransferase [Melioribacter roseus P3M-2]